MPVQYVSAVPTESRQSVTNSNDKKDFRDATDGAGGEALATGKVDYYKEGEGVRRYTEDHQGGERFIGEDRTLLGNALAALGFGGGSTIAVTQ